MQEGWAFGLGSWVFVLCTLFFELGSSSLSLVFEGCGTNEQSTKLQVQRPKTKVQRPIPPASGLLLLNSGVGESNSFALE